MKIALVHYSAPPVVGGVENVMGIHARLMAEAGHQVHIFAGRGEQTDPRIGFHRLPLLDSRHADILRMKAALDIGKIPGEFPDIVSAIQNALSERLDGVDVLIAHNVCSLHKNLPFTAALYKISAGSGSPRLVLWHHDLAWTTPRYRPELHEGYPWDLLRTDWAGATQVVVSELRRDELAGLMGLDPGCIFIIPNGIDVASFLKLEQRTNEIVDKLGLLQAAPLLLLPVRITPRKNIELALRTLAHLRKVLPLAALVVTGPLGPHNPANVHYFSRLLALREELELEGSAHFLAELSEDYLPDSVIADFYRLADVLFLSSREEGFGIPILEAGLSRLPIFCADIPPLRKLASEWATYFSPEADPALVAAEIGKHLSSNPTYTLRKQVISRYPWEQIYAERIAPVLEPKGDVL